MNSTRYEGHLIWATCLSIIYEDDSRTISAVADYVAKRKLQDEKITKEFFISAIGGGVVVGIRHILFQSYVRLPKIEEQFNMGEVNTQSYMDMVGIPQN